jgi:predicted HAD superfamily Cof-like phosphohydrolase
VPDETSFFGHRQPIVSVEKIFQSSKKNMKQPETLNLVSEFHKTFKHPILQNPAIPDEKRCKLRVALIAEELKEFEVAILENDIVGVADALCDIQYVLAGAILEFGLGEKFKDLFEEVQRSNMSKACTSEAEAKETISYYERKDGTECYFKEEAGKYLIYRKSDNKTLKSVNYSPADLDSILSRKS